MADTKLRATLEFVLDANAKKSIRDAVVRATSDLNVRIESANLGAGATRKLRQDIEQATKGANLRVDDSQLDRAFRNIATNSARLQNQLRSIGRGAGAGISEAASNLSNLQRILFQLGASTTRASAAQQVFTAQQARFAAAQRGTIVTTTGVSNALQRLSNIQSIARSSLEGNVRFTRTVNLEATKLSTIYNRLAATIPSVTRSLSLANVQLSTNAQRLRSVRGQVASAQKANDDFNRSLKSTSSANKEFGESIVTTVRRFTSYLVAIRAILAVQQAFRASLDTIVQFDAVLQDLQKVLNETPRGLANISEELFNVARNTGRSVDDVGESFGTFIRDGFNVADSLQRAQDAITATAITTLNQNEATKLITSSLRIFGDQLRDATQLLDILAITGDKSASDQTQIAQALLRTAGAADVAGVGFRELTSLIAATIERTQEAAGKVGTAFKTIFTRVQSNREAFIANANALGANIEASDGLVTILGKLNVLFGQLDDVQKTQLATQIAGQRQVNIFIGLIESFNRALELQEDQLGSAGTAQARLAVEQQKLSVQARNVATNFAQLVTTIAGVDEGADAVGSIRQSLAGILGVLNSVVPAITNFVSEIQDLEAFGVRLSTVFSSVGKLAFFLTGAAIVRSIASGIRGAFAGARQLTQEVTNISRALSLAKGQTDQQVLSEQRVLSVERQREGVLRRILDVSRQIAGVTARTLAPGTFGPQRQQGEDRGRQLTGGQRAVASTALVVAAGATADVLRNLSVEFESLSEQTGDVTQRFAAGLSSATAGGLEFGATLGILTGSLRAGLITGILTAGFQLSKFALEQEKNANILLESVEREAAARFNAETVAATGSQALQEAFRELAERSGQAVDEFEAQAQQIQNIAFANAIQSTDAALQSVGKTLENGRKAIDNIFQTLERRESNIRAGEDLARRIDAARLGESGGRLIGPFSEVDRLLSDITGKFEAITGQSSATATIADQIVRATEAIRLSNEDNLASNRQILDDLFLQNDAYNESDSRLKDIREEFDSQNQSLREQQRLLDDLTRRQKELISTSQASAPSVTGGEVPPREFRGRSRTAATSDSISIAERVAEIEANKNIVLQKQQSLEENISRLKGQETKILAEQEDRSTKNLDLLNEAVNLSEQFIKNIRAIVAETNEETRAIQESTADLRDRIQFENRLAQTRQDGISITERINAIRLQGERRVEEALRNEDRSRTRVVQRIREQAEAARRVNDEQRAIDLEGAARSLEQSLQERRPVIEAQIRAQVEIEAREKLEEVVKEQERILADSRISEIKRIASEEERAAETRINALRKLGSSRVGLQVFERTLRSIPDQAAREFGRVNEAILRIQEQQVSRFAGNTIQELRELETVGLSTGERLREAQERQAAILERSQEQLTERRQSVLDRVEQSSERVNQAEQRLLNVRNQIPQANAQIIQAQRNVASASESVEEATLDLIDAFQSAADAQAALNFQSRLSIFQIRQQTGSFQTVGEQFSELARIFINTNAEIRSSEEQRLQFARQIAQEQLNIVQQQFNAVQGLGVRAATASLDQLADLQNSIGAAAAIAGGQDISQFAPEVLQAVAGLGDLFPGLQRALSEFGLQQLGLNPATLESIEEEMLSLARVSAETGREQVIAADEQVRIAQQQLSQAEADRSLARDQLNVAQDQRNTLLRQISATQEGAAITRAGFSETVNQASRTLERIEGQIFATNEVELAVRDLAKIIQDSRTDIRTNVDEARQELGLRPINEEIDETVTKLTGFQTSIEKTKISSDLSTTARNNETISINGFTVASRDARSAFVNAAVEVDNFIRKLSRVDISPFLGIATGNIQNQAGGSLSRNEITGVLSAARREKRAMPPGSRLMLANTSETVLTRKQARSFGLRPIIKSNAQDGNAAIDNSLAQAVQSLNTSIQSLNNQLNNPTLIDQNVNVTVDTQRTVNIRGVDAINTVVRDLLQDRFGRMASREEVEAIGDSIAVLVQSLNEQGLIGSRG